METETRTQSVVEREVNSLESSVSELRKNLESLEARLGSVLSVQPELAGGNEKPQERLTSLPQAIRNERERVDGANYLLRSILSRLEL